MEMQLEMPLRLIAALAVTIAAVPAFFIVRRLLRRRQAVAAGALKTACLLGAGLLVGLLALGVYRLHLLSGHSSEPVKQARLVDTAESEHSSELLKQARREPVKQARLIDAAESEHSSELLKQARRVAPAKVRALLPDFNFQQAWTDKYPPKEGTSFPEWVASEELRDPPRRSIVVNGVNFSFIAFGGGDGVAGFSGFQATGEEAAAEAWECLRARIEEAVLARCALRAPREFTPVPTALGAATAGRIGLEIEARRALLAIETFVDEIDVAGLGSTYRAAHRAACGGDFIDAIAAVAGANAAAELQAADERRLTNTKTWASLLGGALFLLLIITSIYLFLNAQTKGYYAWPLRIAAGGIYLAAVAACLLCFRRFTGL